jgi:hypothetical protein
MAKRKAAGRRSARGGSKGAATAGARRKTTARKTAARKQGARKAARTGSTRAGSARKRAATKSAGRKTAARKTAARKTRKSAARKSPARKSPARKTAATKTAARTRTARKTASRTAARPAAGRPSGSARATPATRRTVRRGMPAPAPSAPSSLDFDRSASSARSGRRELRERFDEHTETGPAITGGDVDADWESAYSVGDEAPGGDNPTPDQDIVDEIGLALGVQYEDNEELKADEKVAKRDRHRWELDPASSEDYDER